MKSLIDCVGNDGRDDDDGGNDGDEDGGNDGDEDGGNDGDEDGGNEGDEDGDEDGLRLIVGNVFSDNVDGSVNGVDDDSVLATLVELSISGKSSSISGKGSSNSIQLSIPIDKMDAMSLST